METHNTSAFSGRGFLVGLGGRLAAAVANGGRVAVSCPAIEAVQRVSVRGRPSEISQGKCARSRVKRAREAEAEQSRDLRIAKCEVKLFSIVDTRGRIDKTCQAAGSV